MFKNISKHWPDDVEFSKRVEAGGTGGAGQLSGRAQVGVGLGRVSVPLEKHVTVKFLPMGVTCPAVEQL